MADPNDQTTEQPGQAAPDDGNTGFGAAFAERSSDPGKQREDDGTGGDQPLDNEPADKARSDEAPAEAAATGTSDGGASAFDPWNGLTPEQKSHFERLQQSERSNRARVSALQRSGKQSGAAPRAAEAPQTDQAAKPGTDTEGSEDETKVTDLDKRLQDAVSEYGEVIGPVAELLAEVRAEIKSMKGTVSAVEEEISTQELADAYTDLEAAHPDYLALSQDANFTAWLGDQPKQIVELANSFDPHEVSLSLTLFKTERSAAMAASGQSSATQGKQGSTATDVKRQRQLDGSKAISGKGAPAAAGTPNDFSSAFHARSQAKAAEAR